MDPQNDKVDLAEYASAIRRYRTLIMVTTLACMSAALVFSLVGPRSYEAMLTLAVNQSKTGGTGLIAQHQSGDEVVASQGLGPANFRWLFESRAMAFVVIRELGLDKPPYRVTPSQFLSGVISVEEIRSTNLIRLVARSEDPELAVKIAERVAQHAVATVRSASASEATQARDLIKGQLDQIKARFDEANAKLLAYREQAQVEGVKKDVDAIMLQRGIVPELLVKIESEKAKLALIDQELAKRDRVDMFRRAMDSDPLVVASRSRLVPRSAPLGGQSQSESINAVYNILDSEAALTRSNLAALEKQKTQLVDVRKIDAAVLPKLSLLYQRESEIARLTAERDLAEKVYLDVTSRYEVAQLQVAGRSSQLQIIDPAMVPDKPLSRNVIRNAAAAGIGGLSAAAVAAMVLQAWGIASRRRAALDRSA
jgi:uncharacterized protein involved in exopolysaccharide biosynthesis